MNIVCGRALQPFQGRSYNGVVVIYSLVRVPEIPVEYRVPDIALLFLGRLRRLVELGHKLRRFQEPVLINGQFRHVWREGVAPRRQARNMVVALLLE